MRSQGLMRRVARGVATMLTVGTVGVAVVRAQSSRSESLIYAVYNGQDTAGEAFKTMKSAQQATGERIESYAVVSEHDLMRGQQAQRPATVPPVVTTERGMDVCHWLEHVFRESPRWCEPARLGDPPQYPPRA